MRRYGEGAAADSRDKCVAKCKPHNGYNPSEFDELTCNRFCLRVYEDTIPRVVSPAAGQHSWWVRKLPNGREVRYRGGGSLAGTSRTWVDLGDESQAPVEKEDPRHDYGRAMQKDPATKQMLLQTAQVTVGGQDVTSMLQRARADLAALRANPKASITARRGEGGAGGGGAPVQYSRKQAEDSINAYFDSLPTTDCAHPDCDYENTQVRFPRVPVACVQRGGLGFTLNPGLGVPYTQGVTLNPKH